MSTYQVNAPDTEGYDGETKPGVITQIDGYYLSIDLGNLYIKDDQSNDVAVFAPGHWTRVIRTTA